MGNGASSGASSSHSAGHPGKGESSVATSDKTLGPNVGSGGYSCNEQASRASVSSDYPSPKQAKHVVIQALDPKKPRGGLMDKLRQKASVINSSGQSCTNSSTGSRAASLAGSEKSQMSSRVSKRDEYDVDSEDEDLDGFIYDDDSTSEDEREDYVNAFSRRRKKPVGDDYSIYEGAAVRALTAGQKSRMRRTRSSTTDDGDDEWDPEEERIRQLRQQKKHEDHAKAAVLAANKSIVATGVGAGKGDGHVGLGPSTKATAAAAPSPFQGIPPHQQQRITPQPPGEPPVRGSSGSNMRRNVAATGAAPPSPGTEPGPGPGASPGLQAGATAAAAPVARGARPCPAPPAQVNYGASGASQYWQAKRGQNDGAGGPTAGADQGMSRLEQLAAMQKKRQVPQDPSRPSEADNRPGGMPWQVEALGTNTQSQMPEAVARQMEQGGGQLRSSGGGGGGGGGSKWSALDERGPVPLDTAAKLTSTLLEQQQRQQQQVAVAPTHDHKQQPELEPSQRRQLDGQSFIKHLEPPPQQHVYKAKSRGKQSMATTAMVMAPTATVVPQPPPPVPRCLEVTDDFDVDEMLSTFSPSGEPARAHPQEPQQWAGSRPHPPPCTPPSKDFGGATPHQKRSFRAVQSDFTSMRMDDMSDGVTDLAGRVLSLPLPATRPMGSGLQPSLAITPQPTVTSAPVTVSRFARMGATMLAQSSNQEGSGMVSAPVTISGAACHGSGGAAASTPIFSGVSSHQAASPSPVRRPRRSNASSDGTSSPMPNSLSAQLRENNTPAVFGVGFTGMQGQNRGTSVIQATQHPPRVSITGAPGDSTLVLPALRPGSGNNGGNSGARASDMAGGGGGGGSILNTVGRSRFGAAQHQQFQQDVVRSSMPVVSQPQRDYDSDSALTKASGMQRYSYNGAGRGAVGASSVQAPEYDAGRGVFGAAARSRLGQVGA